ncbi:hypothetical protein Agub_g6266, partial [Astrephomene gubernaculifera]
MSYQAKVPLPREVPAGAIFGRQGRNVRWLQTQAGPGTRIFVDPNGITINATSRQSLERAVILLRKQLQANIAMGSQAYPHPARVDFVLLGSAKGADDNVRFVARHGDEVARQTGRREQLFSLAPSCIPQGDTGSTTLDVGTNIHECGYIFTSNCNRRTTGASHAAMATAVDPNEGLSSQEQLLLRVHNSDSLEAVAAALSAAVHSAAGVQPPFGLLKLRFNLGTQFFYNLGDLELCGAVSPTCLQDVGSYAKGKVRSVYGNSVPEATVHRLIALLTGEPAAAEAGAAGTGPANAAAGAGGSSDSSGNDNSGGGSSGGGSGMGFVRLDSATSAMLHVINQELNVHYAIVLQLGEGGDTDVRLERLESSTSKFHFVSLLAGGPLDLRVKMMGQHPDLQDATAREVADHIVRRCREDGFTAFLADPSSYLPTGRHLYCDTVRKRCRTFYTGVIQAPGGSSSHPVEVVVQRIQEVTQPNQQPYTHNKGGLSPPTAHIEVGGALP